MLYFHLDQLGTTKNLLVLFLGKELFFSTVELHMNTVMLL